MPIGDSITAGNATDSTTYRTKLYTSLNPNLPTVTYDFVGSKTTINDTCIDPNHEGYPGYTIDDIISRDSVTIESRITTHKPDIILIHIGTNDVSTKSPLTSTELTAIKTSLNLLIDKIRDTGNSLVPKLYPKIYLASLIPRIDKITDNNNFNNVVQAVVLEQSYKGSGLTKIFFVDMNKDSDIDYTIPTDDLRDNVHPTITGSNKMADVWYEHLTRCPSSSTSSIKCVNNTITLKATPTGGAPAGTNYRIQFLKKILVNNVWTWKAITSPTDINYNNVPINTLKSKTYTIITEDQGTDTSGIKLRQSLAYYTAEVSYLCPDDHLRKYFRKTGCQQIITELNSISVFPNPLNINIGQILQLSTTKKNYYNITMPCPTLTWSSANTSIATVDSLGKVTGISEGAVLIYAKYTPLNITGQTVVNVTCGDPAFDFRLI